MSFSPSCLNVMVGVPGPARGFDVECPFAGDVYLRRLGGLHEGRAAQQRSGHRGDRRQTIVR